MIRALALAALLVCSFRTEANAMLAPHYYEQARRDAPNVIVLELARVETLGPLQCAVHGRVLRVERGRKYARNEEVRILVPCFGHEQVSPPIGGAIFQDTARLQASRYGRAYLSDQGDLLLSQYQITADRNARPPA